MVETSAGPVAVRRTPRESAPADPAPAETVATLLLHGAAGSWTTWLPMVAAAEARLGAPLHDLVIPDLPGWGDSPADVSTLDAAVLARASADVMRALGYRRWRVIGHSLGGFVALELAVQEPAATESVVLVSATTFGGRADALGPLRLFLSAAPLLLLGGGMRVLAALGPWAPRVVGVLERTGVLSLLTAPLFARRVPGTVHELARDLRPAAFLRALGCARRYPAAERWAGIRCPVLAIRGRHDVFVPARDHRRLGRLVPGLRTATLPATGHFAHVEHPSLLARLALAEGAWPVARTRATVGA